MAELDSTISDNSWIQMTATHDYTGGLGYWAAGLPGEEPLAPLDDACEGGGEAKKALSDMDMRFGRIEASEGNVI
jgi:hypothetical protein